MFIRLLIAATLAAALGSACDFPEYEDCSYMDPEFVRGTTMVCRYWSTSRECELQAGQNRYYECAMLCVGEEPGEEPLFSDVVFDFSQYFYSMNDDAGRGWSCTVRY